MSLSTEQNEKATGTAIIVFENEEAAKTALFLNDTFIIDTAISVVPHTGDVSPDSKTTDSNTPATQIQQPSQNNQTQEQAPSLFVNFLASAYMMGVKAWQSAVEFDSKNKITATIKEQAAAVDNQLGFTEKTKAVTKAAGQQISDSYQKLRQRNEQTQKFFEKMDNLGQKISTSFEDAVKIAQQKVDLVKAEIKRREEEDKKDQVTTMEELSEEHINENTPLMANSEEFSKEETNQIQQENAEQNKNNNNDTN